jgi:hypothetical protein
MQEAGRLTKIPGIGKKTAERLLLELRDLTNLEPNDVLFIDEIHRLSPVVEEILYPALEDYQIDIMIGEGPGGALGEARPAAVHPGRRHHARRHADQPAARPLRHRRAAGVLHDPRNWR